MTGKKMHREISVVVFVDKDKNVLLQNRKGHSKDNEKYGFFGGGLKAGENVEEALLRELKEELNYQPNEFKFLGFNDFTVGEKSIYKNWSIKVNYFASPITNKLLNSSVKEGLRYEIIPLDTALTNDYLSKYDIDGIIALKEKIIDYIDKLS